MADTIVIANQSLLGEYVANVLCFSNITNNDTNFQIFADNFRSHWAATIAPWQSTSWLLNSLTFQVIDATQVQYSVELGFTDGPLQGSDLAQLLPTQNAILVSTSYRGVKPNRGRVYLGGFCEDVNNSSAWTSNVLTQADNLVQGMVDGINDGAGDCFLRILRRPSQKFPSFVSSPITGVVARSRPAIIRGRRVN